MPRNVEIKARIRNRRQLLEKALDRATAPLEQIDQDDTFFHCREGRLKLRDFGNGRGELIAYQRADQNEPKASAYRITATEQPALLRETLTLALGELGRVRKTRQLVMIGRTRVHIDQVEGLGEFVELEVVLGEQEPESVGLNEARELMNQLGIEPGDLLSGAYLDLLDDRSGRQATSKAAASGTKNSS